MPTLKELEEENRKLRKKIEARKAMFDAINKEKKLLKENKNLLLYLKHGKKIEFAKGVGKTAGKIGLKTGKAIWNTLSKMEQQRIKNEAAYRKMVSRKTKRKKSSSKKRTRRRK